MFKNLFKSQQPVAYNYKLGIKVYNAFSSRKVIYDAVTKTSTVEVQDEESYVIPTGLTIKCDIPYLDGTEIIDSLIYCKLGASYMDALIKAIDYNERIKKGVLAIKYIPVIMGLVEGSVC